MSSVLLVAAEASSSLFAQRLLEHWIKHSSAKTPTEYFGVGSLAMEHIGFERLGKSEDMAVMGLAEIIEHYKEIKAVFNLVVAEAIKRKPKVAILMDYPGFNLRLAKKLKQLGVPVVYYITPQVWAWRQDRVKIIKQYCDQVFVLFPFEKEFFEKHGVACEFVGHPLLDEMDPKYSSADFQNLQRAKYGVGPEDILVGLMPGSRHGEIKLHMQPQIEVAKKMIHADPRVKILVLCAPTVEKETLLAYMDDVRFPYILLKNDPLEMISLVDVMLAASGTATLQVGLLEKPMVVMYKFKWITGVIAKLIVRGVKFFCIVNLIFGREVVPERWQEAASPEHLFELLSRYLKDPEYTEKVRKDLHQLRFQLGDIGATSRVANALERYF